MEVEVEEVVDETSTSVTVGAGSEKTPGNISRKRKAPDTDDQQRPAPVDPKAINEGNILFSTSSVRTYNEVKWHFDFSLQTTSWSRPTLPENPSRCSSRTPPARLWPS